MTRRDADADPARPRLAPAETSRAAAARLEREARQATALRANLRRRKQQARARTEAPQGQPLGQPQGASTDT